MKEQSSEEPQEKLGFASFATEFLSEAVNIDRGVPGTYWDLFARPEVVVEAYFEDSDRYMNPFRYVVVMVSAVTLILTLSIDFEAFYWQMIEAGMSSTSTMDSLQSLPPSMRGYFDKLFDVGLQMTSKYLPVTYILLMSPAFSLVSYLFFKDRKHYFSQHLVLNLYMVAQISSVTIIAIPILMQLENMFFVTYFTIPLSLILLVWFYSQFFELKGAEKVAQLVVTFILGYIVFTIFLMIAQHSVTAFLYFVV